jgi:hypothetical protein
MKMRGVAAVVIFCVVILSGARGVRAQAAAAGAQTPATAPDAPAPAATIDPELRARIMKMMEITEVSANMQKMWDSMTPSLRPMIIQTFPEGANRDSITDEYLDDLGKSMRSPEAMEGFVLIYAKYLTLADVNAAITFYSTPEGAHVRHATEKMAPEMVKYGQDLAMKNAPMIMKALCDKYPELKDHPATCGDASTPSKSELRAPATVFAGK